MAKGKMLILSAVALLLVVLVLSRLYPLSEGFQTTANKADLCAVLTKGKADIEAQMDEANSLMTNANDQLKKIKDSLEEVSKLTTSFEC